MKGQRRGRSAARSPQRLRVAVYGLGAIGLATVRALLDRQDIELVGAVDNDPKLLSRDVADLSGLKRPSGIRVSDRPKEVLEFIRPDVIILTTGSRMPDIMPQLRECVTARVPVVSSCEELLLPGVRHPALSKELDDLASTRGVAVLGTGVNPGFVMDAAALIATAPCLEVKHLHVERVVNAATRRSNLQRKIGAGMTVAMFRKLAKKNQIGHVGLLESTYLVAQGLGWQLERVAEKLSPVIAKKNYRTPHFSIKIGQVAGIHHTCKGYRAGKEALVLDLQMAVGIKKAVDSVTIKGTPPIKMLFEGGVPGDDATVALLVDMVPVMKELRPGLRTMLDVPTPRHRFTKPV